jgi:hypothetical protein
LAHLNRTGAAVLHCGARSPWPCSPCRMAAQQQGQSARAHVRWAQLVRMTATPVAAAPAVRTGV